jgi:ADP-ribosylglycohydrolase
MKNTLYILFSIATMSLLSCQNTDKTDYTLRSPNWLNDTTIAFKWDSTLTKDVYYNKILGALVGSAIGDAMGAPTEMWHRDGINELYGYVDSLDMVIREGSPEGPWEDNMPEGGTTDDTRWKYLVGGFLVKAPQYQDSLNAKNFAKYIIDAYMADMGKVKKIDAFAPEPLEKELMRMAWLQEWAKVAKPYYEGDLDKYSYAANKFYGGEMACAGMLYAPIIGAYYPANPEKAYSEAYRLGIFDLGYARDITGLTAALVSEAMRVDTNFAHIPLVSRSVDPLRYFNSRLTGRIAYRIYSDAKRIVYEAKNIKENDISKDKTKPHNYKRGDMYITQLHKAYELLDKKLQDIPFHAAEIHLINLTALEFGQGDFNKTLEFVVNYGRDNDTVAAVTGMILGAYLGYDKLPKNLKEKALATNEKIVGIDLRKLAKDITEQAFRK